MHVIKGNFMLFVSQNFGTVGKLNPGNLKKFHDVIKYSFVTP